MRPKNSSVPIQADKKRSGIKYRGYTRQTVESAVWPQQPLLKADTNFPPVAKRKMLVAILSIIVAGTQLAQANLEVGPVQLAPVQPDIAARQQQTLVKLFGVGAGQLDSYGTAVLISSDGHAVTVWNHLINTGYLTAVTADGQKYDVEVTGTDRSRDLAVIKLQTDRPDFPHVEWKQFDEAVPGNAVVAFSNMFRVAAGNEPVSVVHGIIAAETKLKAGLGRWDFPVESPVYLIDAITNNSGAAGGLLLSTDGQLLGLLGREIRHRGTGVWVNYAVPWKVVAPGIDRILGGQSNEADDTKKNKLKLIDYRKLTSNYGLTMLPGFLKKTPAYIDRIIPGSAADAAKLQRGDLVVLVDDTVIQTVDDFRATFSERRSGQKISVTVSRSGQLAATTLIVP